MVKSVTGIYKKIVNATISQILGFSALYGSIMRQLIIERIITPIQLQIIIL